MLTASQVFGIVVLILGFLSYSRLMPKPSTPPRLWLARSLLASSGAAVGAVVFALAWSAAGVNQWGYAVIRQTLSAIWPYVLGGGLFLAVGTYLKVVLWARKNQFIQHIGDQYRR